MNKKKILVFGLSDRVGGVENFYFSYYNKLDKKKYQIDFAVKYDSVYKQEEIEKNGGKVYTIPKFQSKPFLHYLKLKQIIKNGNYDIIHANTVSAADITHLKLAKKYKVKKIIIHSHNCGIKTKFLLKIFNKLNKKKLNKLGTHFLACTKDAGVWLFGKKQKVTVINNAFEIEKFKFNKENRNKIRKELNIKRNEFVIGHVGRMCYQKNQEFLIELFKDYSDINKNSKLVLIGEGRNESMLKDIISNFGLEEKVIIKKSNDPYEYYSAFDAFIFPSRYEGLGIVGVEAQINGLPCLFSNVIPKEIKVNDNVKFLPLNCKEKWLKILKQNKLRRIDKISSKVEIYDINKELEKIDKLYGE